VAAEGQSAKGAKESKGKKTKSAVVEAISTVATVAAAAVPEAAVGGKKKKKSAKDAADELDASGPPPADLDIPHDPDLEAIADLDPDGIDPLLGVAGAAPKKKRRRRDPIEELRRKRKGSKRSVLLVVEPEKKPRKKKKRRDEAVKPSPPLVQTDPMTHYLAGEMVPCPVGCGGFSEVVRISTRPDGSGEVWFECLQCAQRKQFELPPANAEEKKAVHTQLEAGQEITCPRHGTRMVALRRRGREFVCPECGVSFDIL
jgi:hypothetical protein